VPKIINDGILVNVPDRMLYFFQNGRLAVSFPVGLGLPQEQWQTPIGPFSLIRKTTDPTWYVPVSIQKEMEKKGQQVKTVVPPGKDNPLGRYAIHTTIDGVLIHETIWPTTIYQWRSHGCIRVSPEVMGSFFDQVSVGMTGEIIYQPVSVAVLGDRVFLQIARDIYKKVPSIDAEVRAKLYERGLTDKVDWEKVREMIRKRTGIAEDVTR
jgi:L,D-transpeptidase ErfK/SrfK